MKIYLVHPISGLSYDDVVNYYDNKIKFCQQLGLEVLCPMTGKGYLRNEIQFKAHGYDKHPASTNHAIFERDKWMVKSSDIVYASFIGCKGISVGSTMELAWASEFGKLTVVAMEETNPHQHAFILEAADLVFPTEAESDLFLEKLVQGKIN